MSMKKKFMKKISLQCLTLISVLLSSVLLLTDSALAQERLQHQLEPGDQLQITIYGHDDLSGKFEVDNLGTLSLPLIQKVKAEGLTLIELETAITAKLHPDYIKNPKISIEMLNYHPFYIIGEVNNPGSYPFANGLTIMRAVALAGGYTYRAKKNKALLTHANDPDKKKTPANHDTTIAPGDTIEIPERFW